MSEGEDFVTDKFWDEMQELGWRGVLERNFQLINNGEGRRARLADAVVIKGASPDEKKSRKKFRLPNINGREVLIIQTKVTGINPWLFGQVLFSPKLLERWAQERNLKLGKVCSVALCDANKNYELLELIKRYFSAEIEFCSRPINYDNEDHAKQQAAIEDDFSSGIKICLREVPACYQCDDSSISRIPGSARRYAERRKGGGLIAEDVLLTDAFRISGIFVPGLGVKEVYQATWEQLVVGRRVVSIHSEQKYDKKAHRSVPAMSAMYMAGEVIIAQLLLIKEFGATSVSSVIISDCMDRVVDEELRSRGIDFTAVKAP